MLKHDLTQRDMITALYTEIVGINGRGGMRQDIVDVKEAGQSGRKKLHSKIEEIEGNVGEIKDNMITKDNCKVARTEIIENQINPPAQRKRAEILKVRVLELTALGTAIGTVYGIVQLIKYLLEKG